MIPVEYIGREDEYNQETARHVFIYALKKLADEPIESIFDGTLLDDGHYWATKDDLPYHGSRSKNERTSRR